MTNYKGFNLLTKGTDFSKIIPTRVPRAGEARRKVSLQEALEIAEQFYQAHTIENMKKMKRGGK